MRRDGSGLRRLTHNPFNTGDACGCDTDPNFSPDGQLISFVRVKPNHGTALTRLDPGDYEPGRQVGPQPVPAAYPPHALFVMQRDGRHLERLTPYSLDVGLKHDWSPDGTRIVFTAQADPGPGQSANIATIRPNKEGSVQRSILSSPTPPRFIDWGTNSG